VLARLDVKLIDVSTEVCNNMQYRVCWQLTRKKKQHSYTKH